ncbi:MAG: YhdP family protein [Aquabacterium sp.]
MSLSPSMSRPAARGGRWWRGMLRTLAWLLFAAWSLALLVWLIFHWGFLPRLDQWRPQVEAVASRSLGLTVQIGRIDVYSGRWVPALALHDVVLRDAQQREALRLPRVSAALSLRSLLALRLRFDQLLIDGARLEIRRDAQGRIRVAGLVLDGDAGQAGDTALADWFFEQHEFVIRGGTLRWVDELRQAPPLHLDDVLLVVRNGLRRHEMRLEGTPPADWGGRFSLRMRARSPLVSRAGDWQRWHGALHADLPRTDVTELGRYVNLPFELREGSGALRAWLDFADGAAQSATLDAALTAVSLRLTPKLPPLALEDLRARLVGERRPDGSRLEVQGLSFRLADGGSWATSRLGLTLKQAGGRPTEPVTGGELQVDRLDLDTVAQLAERLPLGRPVLTLLEQTRPQGTLRDLLARWDGPLDAPGRWSVKARLQGLTLASSPSPQPGGVGRPGFRNADLMLQADQAGGSAELQMAHGALELPGIFEQALVPLHALQAHLGWQVTPRPGAPPQIALQVRDMRFANDDAQGELSAQWRTGLGPDFGRGGRLPGHIELEGRLPQGRATAVARYLPMGIPAKARGYLERALQAGQVRDAQFRVKGDLWDFPFVQARDGEFRIAAKVQNVRLAYVPDHPAENGEPAWTSPWPAVSDVSADVLIERTSLQVRQGRARLWGLELRDVTAGIRDLSDPVLELDGLAHGPAADLLRYVETSPVGGWIGGALQRATSTGAADLRLGLSLPLRSLDRTSVRGVVTLAGNDFRLSSDVPALAGARGRVEFTQRGIQISGASARAVGGEIGFDGGTQPDGTLRFQGQGTATAEGLRAATELDPLPRVAQLMQGQTSYRLQIGLIQGRPEITVTSPLTGMAIALPAPLGKAAAGTLPLRWQTRIDPAHAARDELRLELGPLLQAQYLREHEGDRTKVLRGGVGLGAPHPWPASGVHVAVNLALVDVDAWSAALDRFNAVAGPAARQASLGYQPSTVALQAGELVVAQRRVHAVTLGLSRIDDTTDAGWRGSIDARQLAGFFEYREPARGGNGRLFARLARLTLPPAEVQQVESLLDAGAGVRMPALDIRVDDFELRGRRLGALEIAAHHRVAAAGTAPVWQLDRLDLRVPEAHLSASGTWNPAAPSAAGRRTALQFKLDVADGGALLDRFGQGGLVRGSKGVMAGSLNWPGSPLAWDAATLDGQMTLAMDAGQFLKADAGAGRLLSVLSLQSLPRRLALDFRDVFQDGFAFDRIDGDLRIAAGVASTNNLRMRGVQAAALMEGQADIVRETQDLRVVVVPEINAGTASLAYAAIQPAIGLTTFFAQWILRGPLRAAGTREFHIDGSWADPQIRVVPRTPGQAVPDLDAVAARPALAPPAPGASAAAGRSPVDAAARPASRAVP